MNFKRIFTAIIALVLVVCLMVNVSPIKAEASVALTITGAVALGTAAYLILASQGVVFHPQTQLQLEAIGNAFSTHMYQWGTSAEELDAVDDFVTGLTIYEGSGGDPDDDDDWQPRFDIPDLIKRGVALFTAACMLGSSIIVENKDLPAPDGYQYYNGYCFPYLPTSYDTAEYPFSTILVTPGRYDYCHFVASREPLASYDDSHFTTGNPSGVGYVHYTYDPSEHTGWYKNGNGSVSFGNFPGFSSFSSIIWTNYDCFVYDSQSGKMTDSLFLASSEPSAVYRDHIQPEAFISDIPEKVQSGEYDENDLVLPDTIYYGTLVNPDLGTVQSVIELSEGLVNGEITFDQYQSLITVPQVNPDPGVDPEPSEPEPSEEPTSPPFVLPDPDIDADKLGDADPNTFLERLGSYITTPFKWIWTKIETTFETLTRPELWTETIPEIAMIPARWIWEKIETYIVPLLNPDALTRPLPEIVAAPFQNLWTNLAPKLDALAQSATQAAQNAASQVTEAIKSTVVPDEDYLSDKLEYIRSKYSFADSLMKTGKDFKDFLLTIGQQPPIIYIDLSAARGFYDMGGKIPFIDLTWYAEYKPKMDVILSAFLWMWAIWRLLIALPGIISGAAGTPGTHDTVPQDVSFWHGFTYVISPSNVKTSHGNSSRWGRSKGGRG